VTRYQVPYLPLTVSRRTFAAALLIPLLSAFGRPLLGLLRDHFGRSMLSLCVWLAFFMVIPATMASLRALSLHRVFLSLLVIGAALSLAHSLELPEERVHLLEFGALGFLLIRDFARDTTPLLGIIATITGGVSFALADEALQGLLPNRVADLRDVGLNCCGVLFGMLLWHTVPTPDVRAARAGGSSGVPQ
jgi:VanZ family protein